MLNIDIRNFDYEKTFGMGLMRDPDYDQVHKYLFSICFWHLRVDIAFYRKDYWEFSNVYKKEIGCFLWYDDFWQIGLHLWFWDIYYDFWAPYFEVFDKRRRIVRWLFQIKKERSEVSE